MRQGIRRSIANVVTALALSGMLLLLVILLTQSRNTTREIQAQTTINQKYLRCLVLLPPEAFSSRDARVKAVDQCTAESRLPNGSTVGGQK